MHCHRAISRRDFLVSTASATVGTLLGDWPGVARAASGEDDLAELTVAAASAAIRKGDLSAERYAAVLLARCDRLKHLKAFVALDRDSTMQAARDADRKRAEGKPLGALHGIPLAIKDNINTAALPTAAGTRALRYSRPKEDAPIVRALPRRAPSCLARQTCTSWQWGTRPPTVSLAPRTIPTTSHAYQEGAAAEPERQWQRAWRQRGSVVTPAARCAFRPHCAESADCAQVPDATPLWASRHSLPRSTRRVRWRVRSKILRCLMQ